MRLLKTVAAALCAALAAPFSAAALSDLDIKPPTISSSSYVLMDALTGTVIAEKDPDTPRAPASLTKMMTAYLVFSAIEEGQISLEDRTIVSEAAREATGSRMFVEINDSVSVRELLLGLVVQSGNDSAVALAEFIAGTEGDFVDLMNQQAKLLGMSRTRFGTATGLPSKGQQSTARDLALLSRALANDFPELYGMHATREFEHNGILQRNRNRMLDEYRGADGIKTGYTRAAGYCLSASAVRHGMRLVGVILDSSSAKRRTREMASLFNYGFNHYRAVELFKPGQSLDEVRVWGGDTEMVGVGYGREEPLRMLLSKADANKLSAVLESNGRPVEAPVAKGDEIALIKLTAGEEVLATVPAVALDAVGKGPWWLRLTDYVRLHWLASSVGQQQ